MFNKLNNDCDKILQPNKINIELKEHQKTAIYAMSQVETDGKITTNNYIIETNIGILADKVGSGKSLMIVSLIDKEQIPIQHPIISYGNPFVCIKSLASQQAVRTNIIIVPHNLVNQWIKFFGSSKLKIIKFNKKKDFEPFMYDTKKEINMIESYDVAIVSANKYSDFNNLFTGYRWARIFIDEVDSIKLPRSIDWSANFIWFITATPNGLKYIYKTYIKYIFSTMSNDIFDNIIIKNEDQYVDFSMALPLPKRYIIECFTPKELQIIQQFIPNSILSMINAGNAKEAIEKLNCNVGTDKNIIQVVTQKIREDLHNQEIKLEAQKKMIVHDKEEYEKKIKQIMKMIEKYQNRLKAIEENIYGMKDSFCPICMGEYENPVLVNCCKNIFCFECIALSLKTNDKCPYCREVIHISDLNFIDNDDSIKKNIKKKKIHEKKPKIEVLQEILNKNKKGKYLIFSNYSETFIKIIEQLNEMNIKHSILSGTNDKIDNTIKKFTSGEINVLMLNAQYYGSGLNLQMATDVIMYHRFNKELEEQVIGRAQRLGRTERLNVYYLLHDNEVNTNNNDNAMEDLDFFDSNDEQYNKKLINIDEQYNKKLINIDEQYNKKLINIDEYL